MWIFEDKLDWTLIAWTVWDVCPVWATGWEFWAIEDPTDINGLLGIEVLAGTIIVYIYAGCCCWSKLEIEAFWTGVPLIEILDGW